MFLTLSEFSRCVASVVTILRVCYGTFQEERMKKTDNPLVLFGVSLCLFRSLKASRLAICCHT